MAAEAIPRYARTKYALYDVPKILPPIPNPVTAGLSGETAALGPQTIPDGGSAIIVETPAFVVPAGHDGNVDVNFEAWAVIPAGLAVSQVDNLARTTLEMSVDGGPPLTLTPDWDESVPNMVGGGVGPINSSTFRHQITALALAGVAAGQSIVFRARVNNVAGVGGGGNSIQVNAGVLRWRYTPTDPNNP
jgi:hypothetical protein